MELDTVNIFILNLQTFDYQGLFSVYMQDTGLHHIQIYNPLKEIYGLETSLGNWGTAFQPMIFRPDSNFGFYSGMQRLLPYQFTPENTKYFLSKRPQSEIHYTLGSTGPEKEGQQGEQIFRFMHSQPIKKGWHTSFELFKNGSAGFYLRQRSNHTSLRLSQSYESKNKKYRNLLSINNNSMFTQENGGLKNPSIFENGGFNDSLGNFVEVPRKELIPVNLQSAENRERYFHLHFSQIKEVGGINIKRNESDSMGINLPLIGLRHSLGFRNENHIYRHSIADSSFYENNFFSIDSSFYQMRLRRFDNEFGASVYILRKTGNANPLSVGFAQELFNGRQDTIGISGLNLSLTGRVLINLPGKISIKGNAKYYFLGRNINDVLMEGTVIKIIGEQTRVSAKIHSSALTNAWTDEWMLSNHFIWENDFRKRKMFYLNPHFEHRKWRFLAGAFQYVFSDYIFFDQSGIAFQDENASLVNNVYIQKEITAGRFNFSGRITWQSSTNNNVRVPDLIVFSSFYYQTPLFKKALNLHIGADVYYFSEYEPYAFMPASRRFILQDQISTGNYPFVDAFVSFQIKRFRFFAKVRHLNQGFPNRPYYITPLHPMQDRGIMIGLRWQLVN